MNQYKAMFGFGIIDPSIKVINADNKCEIAIMTPEGEVETLVLPIQLQITSRESMHTFVDSFFDKIENKDEA